MKWHHHKIILLLSLTLLTYLSEGFATVPQQNVVPITIISGFLGSGKTTLLQHLLTNNQGLRIAVIVNDVAEVNIDNKLIAGQSFLGPRSGNGPAGILQLSNGCACCSLSDELITSISELITISDMRAMSGDEEPFDHIVIELSGISSPKAIRANLQDAEFYGMPIMERVQIDTMVTVVDTSTFLTFLDDKGRRVNTNESPELFSKNVEAQKTALQDYSKEGEVPEDVLDYYSPENSDSSYEVEENLTISQLLVEQIEIADAILLNKADLSASVMNEIETTVSTLNARAKVIKTEFGAVDKLGDVLAFAKGKGVVDAGAVDDHRESVQAADVHLHAHPHNQSSNDIDYDDSSHNHNHKHSYTHENQISSDHDVSPCSDPDCTDPTHCHDHSHGHSHSDSKPLRSFGGIGTYVYRSRRPFHPKRLSRVVGMLPIIRGAPEPKILCTDDDMEEAFGRVIRSKGFVWLADSNEAAMYWSHAGTSFELQCLGRWWATLPRKQWPEEAVNSILSDFDQANHEENGSLETVGDRRNEIVFIGPGMSNRKRQETVCKKLDQCLLTDNEFHSYKNFIGERTALKAAFVNPFVYKMVSY